MVRKTYDATAPGTAKFNLEMRPSHVPIPVEYPFRSGLYSFKISENRICKRIKTKLENYTTPAGFREDHNDPLFTYSLEKVSVD